MYVLISQSNLIFSYSREYTTKEFDELCFQFGIELDEDVSI